MLSLLLAIVSLGFRKLNLTSKILITVVDFLSDTIAKKAIASRLEHVFVLYIEQKDVAHPTIDGIL